MALHILQGDATVPQASGPKLIVHICNDLGRWGKGFVVALSRRWPDPEASYRKWHRHRADNDFGLGAVQVVPVARDKWVANLVGQRGTRTGSNGPPIRYRAVRQGLAAVRPHARELGASIHMPRIGCGLAGGRWSRIEPVVIEELVDHDFEVYVYDYRG